MSPDPALLRAVLDLIQQGRRHRAGLFILGMCGAQGSGKTTLTRYVVAALQSAGIRAAALSLDDLYLTRAEREVLARDVHPLLRTRGVPGTHDVALGNGLLDALARGEPAALPRFDKARDDRAPPAEWAAAPENLQVLIVEGWCVGARAQPEADLREPINDLERYEDADCRWRTYVNARLANEYQTLFARLDTLVLLAAPNFDVVADWRFQQEQDLAQEHQGLPVMDEAAVARFVKFYERITRNILTEMPARADLVAQLDTARQVISLA